jgi:hypothetical protein
MEKNMKKALLALILCFTMTLTGCTAAWVSTVDTVLAVAAPALTSILQIVAIANGRPLNTGLVNKINADVAEVKKLASDFSKASASAGPGVCKQLEGAIGVYGQDVQAVLVVAHVTNPATQQKIEILSTLVIGTVDAILAVIPACQSSATAKKSYTNQTFDAKKFVKDYNDALVAKTGNVAVDSLTPKLKLPYHSKAYRYTIGLF